MTRYLTKSRFKTAMNCPPKLFYCNKGDEYADEKLDDPFLASLAEGGFQVGELAKYLFCNDPIAEQITIEERDYDRSVALTEKKLFANDNPVIAEAAFRFENLFIRVDITTRKDTRIDLYEVKAKSWKPDTDFWKTTKQGEVCPDKKWLPYLYDIAFQKWVVQKAYPDYEIRAHMIFADSDAPATINGLNQLFRIEKNNGRSRVNVVTGTNKATLGAIPLRIVPVDTACEWIYSHPVEVDLEEEYSFEGIIKLFSEAYRKDERIWSPLSSKCKSCEFVNTDPDSPLKSGFSECWKHWAGLNDDQLKIPLVLELWGGKAGSKSIVSDAITHGKYFITSLEDADYFPKSSMKTIGLSPAERRKLQITKVRQQDHSPWLDRNGLLKIFDQYSAPYHFIDFETTMVALPFHEGRKPYEAIAFQYSHHLMNEKGAIEHKGQYISLSPGFPNYDFVRALKKELHGTTGTIFRYHNHENNYLNFIKKQLESEPGGVIKDRDDLVDFIEDITHEKNGRVGPNDMKDLWDLVLSYYYSPFAKGSNSIKDILPAVINDSGFTRDKYSKPVYGTREMPSHNFHNHTWISADDGLNPYRALPDVLNGYHNDQLDEFVPAVDEIKDGGAAMMAYAYLQFTDVHPDQKALIKDALYRYCELDTMAMVMIWEYWGHEIGFFR